VEAAVNALGERLDALDLAAKSGYSNHVLPVGSRGRQGRRTELRLFQKGVLGSMLGAGAVIALLFGIVRSGGQATGTVARYETISGQQSVVRRPDGTTIHLAPATVVTVSGSKITVTGAAYFTVAAHQTRPVVVQTVSATIRVLGTRFVVRQYPEDRRGTVAVEEGRVALQLRHATSESARAVVAPNMVAFVTDSTMTVTSGVAIQDYTGWTDGRLTFDRVPLRNVVAELSLAYGATIQVADSTLASETIVADIDVHQKSLTQVLDFISYTMRAHYEQHGKVLVLLPGHAAKAHPAGAVPRTLSPKPEREYGK